MLARRKTALPITKLRDDHQRISDSARCRDVLSILIGSADTVFLYCTYRTGSIIISSAAICCRPSIDRPDADAMCV